ncbi:sensor histidine kinase [Ideonella sp. 4Y16]|uniref:ATP-binding protein n=1 Tax=Ideonella alba TaxID=2824118 RepID=UPI001B3823D0|nr:ATP-binding protein [Ideonella alba]MBQ0946289.1 sensor histidine kinase [Ideonella alba]
MTRWNELTQSWGRPPGRRGVGVLLLALALVGAAAWAGYAASTRRGTDALRAEAKHQLDLFASVVQGMVRRLEYVPATLQLHPDVLALLRQPADAARQQAAGDYLRRLNAHLGSASVHVLDASGRVIGASDPALLDEDLSFRPYFQEAMAGRVGRHFAIGLRDGVPGYYVSHPVHDGARVIGVAVLKIGLGPVDQAWALLEAPALLADSNQVVVLSSQPQWRYTALAELPPERQSDVRATRLYGDQPIRRLPLQVDLRIDEDSQIVEGVLPEGLRGNGERGLAREMLVLGRTLDGMDWRLLMFTDLRPVRQDAVQAGLLAGVSTAFVLALAVVYGQRRRITRQKLRAHHELETQVAARTQALSEANERLRTAVAERQQAEQTLRRAQDELVHAGKMAALGQLATGITHELTQPLGAIRTLSANAVEFMRRGEHGVAADNLGIMARLADQMGAIIEPLKGFARKSQARPQASDVAQAVRHALFLYDQRLRREAVEVIDLTVPGAALAWCDPNRLEQVLVNLIGNALDAMRDAPTRRLWIAAELQDGQARIQVRDSGPGISAEVLAHLFEPFFSTKEAGVGLGLGLAISRDIAREAGGELSADNHADGGACFTLRLPLPPTP